MNRSKIQHLGNTTEIINNPVDFPQKSDRGKTATEYLSKLNEQLRDEHSTNLKEIQELGEGLNRVSSIVAAQQKYTHITGMSELLTPKELIEMAIEMSLLSFEDRIDIVFDYQYDKAIRVERHKVIQVLINLLNNAKRSLEKTNQKDKTIRIITRAAEEDRVQIEVVDNGVGLEADALSRIFTFDVSDTAEGQDLDLHASANAANSIGGSLMAASDGQGKGSSFMLELPIT